MREDSMEGDRPLPRTPSQAALVTLLALRQRVQT